MAKESLTVGLDIGNYSLKAVILERVSGKIGLRQLVIAEKLDGIDKEDISEGSFIVKVLKDNILSGPAGKFNIAFSLAGQYIRFKAVSQIITTDKIDGTFDHAVWFRKDIIEDVPFRKPVVDYWVISDKIKKGTPVEIMAVCAEEQLVSKIIIGLQELGLKASGVEVDHTAILRNIKYSGLLGKENKDLIFLDIGAKISKMGVVKDDKLFFVRDMMVGGNTLTTALANNLNISLQEAETKKRKTDFFPADRHSLNTQEDSLVSAAEPMINKLISEIKRSLLFYKIATKQESPGRMLLLGGGSKLKGLDQVLAKELSKDVKIFNPLETIVVEEGALDGRNSEEVGPSLSVAIGLGLLSFEHKSTRSLNLIPVDLRPRRSKAYTLDRLNPVPVFGVLLSILLVIYFALAVYKFSLDKKLISVESEWSKVQQEAAEIKKIRKAKSELVTKEEFVSKIAFEQYLMPLIMKTLSELVPDGAWLINLSMSEKVEEVAIEAKPEQKQEFDFSNPDMLPPENYIESGSTEEPTTEERSIKILEISGGALFSGLVPQIMTNLKNRPLFSDISLKDFKEEDIADKKVIYFTISCRVRGW